jgi:hypothetical protein
MHDVLDEVNVNNEVKMQDYDHSICILDPIFINLDEEDTLDDVDNEYEAIHIDIDLPNLLSSQLIILPSIEHVYSQGSLFGTGYYPYYFGCSPSHELPIFPQ